MLNTGNIYLNKILGITLCWALWKKLFTQNTGDYFMLNTVGRFIYTKYWALLLVEHCENIYLHKILGNTLCWTLGKFIYTKYWGIMYVLALRRFIYTKYWGILYVEHCGKIYLHKILRNTLCWTLWDDLFIQNTEEYCMLGTVGSFIYIQYLEILYVEHCGNIYLHKILGITLCCTLWEDLFTQNTGDYFMLHTVGRFIYTKYWWLP
jgi:hypothetical protein